MCTQAKYCPLLSETKINSLSFTNNIPLQVFVIAEFFTSSTSFLSDWLSFAPSWLQLFYQFL